MKNISFKRSFAIFNPPNLKQQAMSKARPQPSATISLRMYVLVVIAVRKDPVTWDTDFSGGLTDRGYTMHEHLDDFMLINMNGRIYDPLLGRFLSPDNHIQAPDNPQNYNRYAYALNNPLVYTDPTGEFFWAALPVMIKIGIGVGAAIGGYTGYKIGEANGASGLGMLGYVLGGAAIGGVSGYLGGTVAAGGGIMANTSGIMLSSYANSMGMAALSGARMDPSISFGAASYDFGSNEWGYLGKPENSKLENIGYGFGALANLADVVSLFGGGTNLDVNSADAKKPNEWWGHSSATDKSGNIDISVGPSKNGWTGTKMDYLDPSGGGELWRNYAGKSGTWTVKVNNVNRNLLEAMSQNISNGKGLYGIGQLKWNIAGFSCVNHVSRSLWAVGVPTLPINLHPYILNAQLVARQMGIYSSAYLYDF